MPSSVLGVYSINKYDQKSMHELPYFAMTSYKTNNNRLYHYIEMHFFAECHVLLLKADVSSVIAADNFSASLATAHQPKHIPT